MADLLDPQRHALAEHEDSIAGAPWRMPPSSTVTGVAPGAAPRAPR